MLRIESVWSGGGMGAGLTVFNLASTTPPPAAATVLDPISVFWNAARVYMPSSVSVQVSNVIQEVDTETGLVTSSFTGAAQPNNVGVDTGPFAGGVGCRIRWTTAGVRRGRNVVGTTFIVPIATAYYETNGTLTASIVGGLAGMASTLRTSLATAGNALSVWSRPLEASGEHPAEVGMISATTGAGVTDRVSWLTTRRS